MSNQFKQINGKIMGLWKDKWRFIIELSHYLMLPGNSLVKGAKVGFIGNEYNIIYDYRMLSNINVFHLVMSMWVVERWPIERHIKLSSSIG